MLCPPGIDGTTLMIRTVPIAVLGVLLLTVGATAQPSGNPSPYGKRLLPPIGQNVPGTPRVSSLEPNRVPLQGHPQTPNVLNHANFGIPAVTAGMQPGLPRPGTANLAIQGNLFEAAQIIAIVGGETILAGDIEAEVMAVRERIGDQVTDEQFDVQRPVLTKQILKKRIDTMLVYQDFLSQVPEERHGDLLANINRQFYRKQVPLTIKKYKVESIAELDVKLREQGSSLKRLQRDFTEQVIAQEMIRKSSSTNKEITHEQMLSYYHDHIEDYEFLAKAIWEELMVEFQHYRNTDVAYRDIVKMGNEVLHGAPLDAVAKRSQQGPRWEKGGRYDWTVKESLRSEPLNEAIFSLPIGKLSQIIRDDEGFHIIRVIKREEAGRVPFTKAQVEIKKHINNDRKKDKLETYIQNLRESTPVSTIFANA